MSLHIFTSFSHWINGRKKNKNGSAVYKDSRGSTYLIQFSGSALQSMLHRNLSHVNQPMGGVKASPLSRHCVRRTANNTKAIPNNDTHFAIFSCCKILSIFFHNNRFYFQYEGCQESSWTTWITRYKHSEKAY